MDQLLLALVALHRTVELNGCMLGVRSIRPGSGCFESGDARLVSTTQVNAA